MKNSVSHLPNGLNTSNKQRIARPQSAWLSGLLPMAPDKALDASATPHAQVSTAAAMRSERVKKRKPCKFIERAAPPATTEVRYND